MSKYSRVGTKFLNRIALRRALEEVFGKGHVEDCETPKALIGYHGDTRPEKADLIVRRKYVGSSSNDLGWTWNAATGVFDAIVSEYDAGHARSRLDKLTQAYAVEVAKMTAEDLGYVVSGVIIGADGSMNLEVELPEMQYAQTYV